MKNQIQQLLSLYLNSHSQKKQAQNQLDYSNYFKQPYNSLVKIDSTQFHATGTLISKYLVLTTASAYVQIAQNGVKINNSSTILTYKKNYVNLPQKKTFKINSFKICPEFIQISDKIGQLMKSLQNTSDNNECQLKNIQKQLIKLFSERQKHDYALIFVDQAIVRKSYPILEANFNQNNTLLHVCGFKKNSNKTSLFFQQGIKPSQIQEQTIKFKIQSTNITSGSPFYYQRQGKCKIVALYKGTNYSQYSQISTKINNKMIQFINKSIVQYNLLPIYQLSNIPINDRQQQLNNQIQIVKTNFENQYATKIQNLLKKIEELTSQLQIKKQSWHQNQNLRQQQKQQKQQKQKKQQKQQEDKTNIQEYLGQDQKQEKNNQNLNPLTGNNQNTLKIVTLNYCDIMNNPYQFFIQNYDNQQQQMSRIMQDLLIKNFKDFDKNTFNWQMGKIDKKIRKGRYSPTFQPEIGIIDNKFIDRQTFYNKWETQFAKIIEQNPFEYSQQQKNITKLYDFIIYHTLLIFVYGQDTLQNLTLNNPQKYRQKINPYFCLSFLDNTKKLQKMKKYFELINADVFFMQQYCQDFKNYIQKQDKYHIANDPSKDTIIFAKKQKFHKKYNCQQILTPQQIQSLNWADRTAILVVDSYILINVHLNSKLQKCQAQGNQLKKTLVNIKQKYDKFQVILGGDLNFFLKSDQQFQKLFSTYPQSSEQYTSIKKRTTLQGQFNKSHKYIKQSKDRIISNLTFLQGKVCELNEKQVQIGNNRLLPSQQHPFDHFMVEAKVKRYS